VSAVVAAVTAALVVLVAWARRPAPRRVRGLLVATTDGVGIASPTRRRLPVAPGSPATLLGGWVRRRFGRPADRAADRHLGRALLLGIPALVVSPTLALAVGLWWWAAPLLRRRREDRRREAELRAELPEVVDLYLLAIGAGLTVALAVPAVARHHRGRLGAAFGEVARRNRLGERLADALAMLPTTVGEPARPLVTVLVGSERYGVALLPALERLAAEARLDRRRAAEAAARRVPVKLLFPLVLCTLPAFALLTVVPLLAGSLRSLQL